MRRCVMKVAFIDPANMTHYYNLSFVNGVGKYCKLWFLTSKYSYETLSYPGHVNSKFVFFRAANYVDGRVNRKELKKLIKGAEYPFGYLALFYGLQKIKPDIVHVNWPALPEVDLLAIKVIKSMGFPVICTSHNPAPHDIGMGKRYNTYRRLFHNVDHVVCLTHYVKREIVTKFHLDQDKVSIVPHGDFDFVIDQAEETESSKNGTGNPISASEVVISFFGLIRPYKGLEYLLKALPAIIRRIPRCKLLVFGSASPEHAEHYRAMINGLGLSGSVICDFRFVPLKEMVAYLKVTDIAVLSYVNASQSGSIPMLSKMGIPVVATRVGGLPEMIEEGTNGVLVPPRSPEAIADAVCELLKDPERLRRMKTESVRYAKQAFSWDKIAQEMIGVYEKVLEMSLTWINRKNT